jgi:GlcNAc-P-P-Und epimerase
MKRVLVTGATGFLGHYVAKELSRCGRKVVRLARRSDGSPDVIVCDLEHEPIPFFPESFDEVYHVAGLAHFIPQNESERERFYTINCRGTEKLLAALDAGEGPQSLVLISTVAVYGINSGIDLDENTPLVATDPYGASKKIAEDVVSGWCSRRGVRAGIVRLPLLVGAGAPGNLRMMGMAIQSGRYLGIGDGAARRSIVAASDVAAILPTIAEFGGTYNLTDGRHPSFAEIEATIAGHLKRHQPIRLPVYMAKAAAKACDGAERLFQRTLPFGTRALTKMTSTLTFSDQKARRLLGWEPSAALDHFGDLLEDRSN